MERGVVFPEVSHGQVYSAVRRSGRPQRFDRGRTRARQIPRCLSVKSALLFVGHAVVSFITSNTDDLLARLLSLVRRMSRHTRCKVEQSLPVTSHVRFSIGQHAMHKRNGDRAFTHG